MVGVEKGERRVREVGCRGGCWMDGVTVSWRVHHWSVEREVEGEGVAQRGGKGNWFSTNFT